MENVYTFKSINYTVFPHNLTTLQILLHKKYRLHDSRNTYKSSDFLKFTSGYYIVLPAGCYLTVIIILLPKKILHLYYIQLCIHLIIFLKTCAIKTIKSIVKQLCHKLFSFSSGVFSME